MKERENSVYFLLEFLKSPFENFVPRTTQDLLHTQMCLLISCPSYVMLIMDIGRRTGDPKSAGALSDLCIGKTHSKCFAVRLEFLADRGKYFPLCDKVPPSSLPHSPDSLCQQFRQLIENGFLFITFR